MNVRWRRWSWFLLIVLLGAALVAGVPALRTAALRTMGQALVVDEPVESADIIVVPRWAGGAGVIDAADLVHRGIAGRVAVLPEPHDPAERELIRRGISYHDQTADLVQLLHALGVANVEVIPDPVSGTHAEAYVLLSWCDLHQFRSIVVVSAPDHSRRVRRALHRAWRGHPTNVIVRSARYSTFDPNRWWETRDGTRIAIVELQKLVLDFVRHPMP
jgi:hypothetical protein